MFLPSPVEEFDLRRAENPGDPAPSDVGEVGQLGLRDAGIGLDERDDLRDGLAARVMARDRVWQVRDWGHENSGKCFLKTLALSARYSYISGVRQRQPHQPEQTMTTTTRISCTPRSTKFAGRTVLTNPEGEGIFTRRADGTYHQHTGTSQTPTFRNARHLAQWLRAHYPDEAQAYAAQRRAERQKGR